MSLPLFFIDDIGAGQFQVLDEDASRHVVQVLRMRAGEPLQLTDGRGHLITAEIADAHKKKCAVKVTGTVFTDQPPRKITIAIALLKSSHRFEWFLEKATEIGVSRIIPLITSRTEKQHFRHDRMKNILVSAMLQSQQVWLPVLDEPMPFQRVLAEGPFAQRFIAHCAENIRQPLLQVADDAAPSCIMLIGPEGDFTTGEIEAALAGGFVPVILGDTRLRTETAGVVAAALLAAGN